VSALDDLPPLRDVIQRHGLAARRSLGQNFLLDLNLTARIARAAGDLRGVTVVEVGPGPGGLTRALLALGAGRVIAVEKDSRAIAALVEVATCYPGRLEVVEGDALALDLGALAGEGPARIVANLPYNVATPLLAGWLTVERWPPWWDSLTLMFQREVAQRIIAASGSAAFGRLGVLAGWRCEAQLLFEVPASAFVPPPKVTSAVVRLVPRIAPDPAAPRDLEAVTRAAFGQRRKMLRQSLKAAFRDPLAVLAACGIEPTRRAEELDVAAFAALARRYAAERDEAGR
jgi:16S rRNA (adenine1518-N6/adenine1519-N6)-dimethyltransferase